MLDDSFRDTQTGHCIERRLSRVRVAPFTGANRTVRGSFTFE